MIELPVPEEVKTDKKSVELLRLWAANGKQVVTLNIGVWRNNGHDEAMAWGIALSDFIKHVENALNQKFDIDQKETRKKILDTMNLELEIQDDKFSGK